MPKNRDLRHLQVFVFAAGLCLSLISATVFWGFLQIFGGSLAFWPIVEISGLVGALGIFMFVVSMIGIARTSREHSD